MAGYLFGAAFYLMVRLFDGATIGMDWLDAAIDESGEATDCLLNVFGFFALALPCMIFFENRRTP
jgi:hypothetical protein